MAFQKLEIENDEETIACDFAVLELKEDASSAMDEPQTKKYLLDDDSIFSDLNDSPPESTEECNRLSTSWLDDYTPEEDDYRRSEYLLSDDECFSALYDSTPIGEEGKLAAYLVPHDEDDCEDDCEFLFGDVEPSTHLAITQASDSHGDLALYLKPEPEVSMFERNRDCKGDLALYLIPEDSFDADQQDSAGDLAAYLLPDSVCSEDESETSLDIIMLRRQRLGRKARRKKTNSPRTPGFRTPSPRKRLTPSAMPGYLRPTTSSTRKKRGKHKISLRPVPYCA